MCRRLTKPFMRLCSSLLLLSLCCVVGCVRETPSTVPEWPVYYRLSLLSAQGKPLNAPGGYVLITAPNTAYSQVGFAGLLVLRSVVGEEAYYAYDLACPYERNQATRLRINDALEAECPVCGSRFSILFGAGNPLQGPAQAPLLIYQVLRSAPQELLIVNRH